MVIISMYNLWIIYEYGWWYTYKVGPHFGSKLRSVGVHITPIELWFLVYKYSMKMGFLLPIS